MKKVLAICLMMVMVLSVSTGALADNGGFVSSPSRNLAPRIISFDPLAEDCTATLIVTPYAERNTLPADLKNLIERAYGEIAASDDLTELNDQLAQLAADKDIDGQDLAVSDLFDLRVEGCQEHDDHVSFDIVIEADTLKGFVGLLHMTTEGEWELVSNATVEGKLLKFTVDSLSPFAVVVETDDESDPDKTGDNFKIWMYAAVMAVSGLAMVLIAIKSKKAYN